MYLKQSYKTLGKLKKNANEGGNNAERKGEMVESSAYGESLCVTIMSRSFIDRR